MILLKNIFSACYLTDGAEIGAKATRNWGTFNAYYVYSRDYPYAPKQIYPTLASANLDARDFRSKVVILVHDHQGRHGSLFDTSVRFALLNNEDVTIIVVDWSLPASLAYSNAVSSVPNVGANIAELIRLLLQYRRITLANLHIVGFGLGAHVAAFAARSVNGVVARITGLDPSPLEGSLLHSYLKPGDAGYVEVIHTDGDGMGMGTAIGNADFFPNGGIIQPGCSDDSEGGTTVAPITIDEACNHNRAFELFAISIYVNLFGRACTTTVVSEETCRGYSLRMGTNDMVKFGQGSFFLAVDIADIDYHIGKLHFESKPDGETIL
uniref:Lipase domain-containing protein n=1 Tax=Pectinophora gossypiella TaxID=13191 RepID=A0A1E1VXV5_PECGO